MAASGAAFGVRFDKTGEGMYLVDDTGRTVGDDRALLVVLDLVAAERGGAAWPYRSRPPGSSSRSPRFHGVAVAWTTTSPDDLTRIAAQEGLIFAGDGHGGYVVPESSAALDGVAALVRPTAWAAKGAVMRSVVEAAGDLLIDSIDGVRVVAAPAEVIPARGWRCRAGGAGPTPPASVAAEILRRRPGGGGSLRALPTRQYARPASRSPGFRADQRSTSRTSRSGGSKHGHGLSRGPPLHPRARVGGRQR